MLNRKPLTFAGFPGCEDLDSLVADVVILGIPNGIPYQPGEKSPSHDAPTAIRRQSMRYPEDVNSWDFDLNNTLLGDSKLRVVDCGDLPGEVKDPEGNLQRGTRAVQKILEAGAVPVILGGDDSIPNMVFPAFERHGPINIVQIDAHIDWRHEIDGVTHGFSSPMRRASELPWVDRIIQVGARGTGTARPEDRQAALDYGARIITAYEVRKSGIGEVLDQIPSAVPCYLTIDCDGLDPAIMPGVWSPSPGGLYYYEMIDLMCGIQEKAGLAGLNLLEYVPNKDINQIGEITAMRIIWNFIGELAKASIS
jgi:agmatinase